jgi:hypothetical protein
LGVCSLNDAYKGLPLQCRQHTCQACHMPQVTHCWRAQTNSAQAPPTVHTIEGARKISAKPTSTLLHCSCCPACTNPNSLRQLRWPPQFRYTRQPSQRLSLCLPTGVSVQHRHTWLYTVQTKLYCQQNEVWDVRPLQRKHTRLQPLRRCTHPMRLALATCCMCRQAC